MNISAWHCSHDYFFTVSRNNVAPAPKKGFTHYQLPIMISSNAETKEAALEEAFRYFNWVDFDFMAPEEVNEFCKENDTHASMSVGDIVGINGKEFWVCKPVGWERVHTDF